MHQYSVRDVERLVHIPRSTIRSLVEAGLVSPARGPRNAWLFSFQDLIVLRTAQELAEAKVPRKRITASVRELRRRLPEALPLSGVSISAEADRVVVKEGDRRWQVESGQYLLAFERDSAETPLGRLGRQDEEPPAGGEDWFRRGMALESQDREAAMEAYERAVLHDPGLHQARINLGCLLHEAGRLDKAEGVYREAIRVGGGDPLLLYNLGVLLADTGRKSEAAEAYRAALRADPGFADCHYNLALLCQGLGQLKDAIRHMAAYRRLTSATRQE
ncbi:MAG TPA: tetratricopeptide repeat protein [Candidatus Polarisedimenticolia bacterium]|nr:tetratricopeptide repeat protein [Candidatus Polarisedimenticolia bacterium]